MEKDKKKRIPEEQSKQPRDFSRREFLKDAGLLAGSVAVGSIAVLSACKGEGTTETVNNTITETKTLTDTKTVTATPEIKLTRVNEPDAKYTIVSEPTICTGCFRCEIACTEFNFGICQPSIANIKVSRNDNFGAGYSALDGYGKTAGEWGNGRVVPETCRQCPHPVPCLEACPNGAIEIDKITNARVVNKEKCVGCGTCVKACPWGMVSLDIETKKANKCTLCGGNPKCVEACPSGALKMITWIDRTKDLPGRNVVPGYVSNWAQKDCGICH